MTAATIQAIQLSDGQPTQVTLSMSVQQAALVTKVIGRMSRDDLEKVMTGADVAGYDMYCCLDKQLFDRFWSNGIDGYLSGDKE